ncbi:hypothetical protein ACOSP7_013657 [Xanthoceras sorbifolium]
MESKQEKAMSIVMLPHLAYGHVSPYFELAKKLSNKGFQIYLCSTPICLESIRNNLMISSSNNIIQLIDLQLPSSFHQELPPHYHSTKNLPPHLKNTLLAAFDASKPAFSDILRNLKPDLVIFDLLQPWAGEAAREQNIEAVMFLTCGGMNSSAAPESPSLDEELSEAMLDTVNGITTQERCTRSFVAAKMVLIKASREIIGGDCLSMIPQLEMVPIGPLVPKPQDHDDDERFMNWLNKRNPSSVVFVSFGTEYFLSQQEIEEMAYGLELSGVDFIWVVRFHGGSNIRSIHEALPGGFLERIEGKGMIVEGWAPQAKILQHSSTGGFVSHCGWSSTLEAMVCGVPIIAIPMQLDQPMNAKLVVDIGVGMEVPKQNKKLVRKEVASVIRRVVVEEEGKEVRRRVKDLSERLKKKEDEEFDKAAEKLVKLVQQSGNHM